MLPKNFKIDKQILIDFFKDEGFEYTHNILTIKTSILEKTNIELLNSLISLMFNIDKYIYIKLVGNVFMISSTPLSNRGYDSFNRDIVSSMTCDGIILIKNNNLKYLIYNNIRDKKITELLK